MLSISSIFGFEGKSSLFFREFPMMNCFESPGIETGVNSGDDIRSRAPMSLLSLRAIVDRTRGFPVGYRGAGAGKTIAHAM